MRIIGSLAALCLLSAPSLADPSADPRLTWVDDEPMSHRVVEPATHAARANADRRLPEDIGQFRAASVSAPAPRAIDSGPMTARDHDVAAPHLDDSPTYGEGAGDLMTELAVHQLAKETRRHQRDIDACVAAAQRRHPAAVGTVTLSLTIADRALAGVIVAANEVHDADLAACLVRTAKTFKFSLAAAAAVTWPVTLTPSAAR